MFPLEQYGFGDRENKWLQVCENVGMKLGRVVLEHKRLYRVMTEMGELIGAVSGKFRYETMQTVQFPSVGDWVRVSISEDHKVTIHEVFPRFSQFTRKSVDSYQEDALVTNVDTVWIVQALNQDFNVRRLERYLVMAWESCAHPVVILNKCDLCTDIEQKVQEAESVAVGVPIHVISAEQEIGLNVLQSYLGSGQTVGILGSSGAGKSTLTNKMAGREVQLTQAIRDDDGKGRHTTTERHLISVPAGGCLVDTPGMRSLQLWSASTGLSDTYEDILELAKSCKFSNCQHKEEPDCAIQEALEEGILPTERFQSYLKLQRELAHLERKVDKQAAHEAQQKWKKINKMYRKHPKRR
ncbi:ribosome small subunit-dependent GTPase A [Risungbinella massiliensis]|uniref:ribosome small subunit-dependent GTPase A n=1 Tax=Risungbinella massiliensis TaxID=1329796 RepID=UPI0005CC392E|nr:ribosome small subunit-dependent GTPase A [Risungbinella massiliensis]